MSIIKCASPTCQCKRGTPKTLQLAIINAIESIPESFETNMEIATRIETHVRDFLAQKFGAHELEFSGQETEALWKSITGEPPTQVPR